MNQSVLQHWNAEWTSSVGSQFANGNQMEFSILARELLILPQNGTDFEFILSTFAKERYFYYIGS